MADGYLLTTNEENIQQINWMIDESLDTSCRTKGKLYVIVDLNHNKYPSEWQNLLPQTISP